MKRLVPLLCITSLFLCGCFSKKDFTGITENYRPLAHLKDGKEGEWRFYHDNGQLGSIGNFKNDKQTGESRTYYQSGRLESIGFSKNGMVS